MYKEEIEKYKDKDVIAVYPMGNWGGIEILDIEHGIEDYAIARYNYDNVPEKPHRNIIRTNSKGRAFFVLDGRRIYLDECMKTTT